MCYYISFHCKAFYKYKIINAKTHGMTMVTNGDDNLLCTSSLLDPKDEVVEVYIFSLSCVAPMCRFMIALMYGALCDGST